MINQSFQLPTKDLTRSDPFPLSVSYFVSYSQIAQRTFSGLDYIRRNAANPLTSYWQFG